MTCEGSDQKIRALWVCDGVIDCHNGADEASCGKIVQVCSVGG